MTENVDELFELNTGITVFVELTHDAIDVCLLELDVELSEYYTDFFLVNGAIAIFIEEIEGSFEAGQLLLV